MASGWIKLCRIPTPTNSYISKPIFKSVNKIILSIGETAEKIISILEYDTIKDECTEIIHLQNAQKYRPGSVHKMNIGMTALGWTKVNEISIAIL